jgi:hypothetical protein
MLENLLTDPLVAKVATLATFFGFLFEKAAFGLCLDWAAVNDDGLFNNFDLDWLWRWDNWGFLLVTGISTLHFFSLFYLGYFSVD